MSNYTIPENPQYTTEIRKLENTDPANAEAILNPLIETLIENTHAVKQKADSIEVLQERMDSQQAELSGKADNEHQHDVGDISSGILSIARGGTGGSTVAEVRNNLGLGNTVRSSTNRERRHRADNGSRCKKRIRAGKYHWCAARSKWRNRRHYWLGSLYEYWSIVKIRWHHDWHFIRAK